MIMSKISSILSRFQSMRTALTAAAPSDIGLTAIQLEALRRSLELYLDGSPEADISPRQAAALLLVLAPYIQV